MSLPSIYCFICGGPFQHRSRNFEWTTQVTLFTLPTSLPRFEEKNRHKDDGPPEPQATEQPSFFGPVVLSDEPEVFYFEQREYFTSYPDKYGNMTFPMHCACAEIITRVVSGGHGPKSLREFYEAMCRRRKNDIEMDRAVYGELGPMWKNGYYGAENHWLYDGWDYEEQDHEMFLRDPLGIPAVDLTDYVLSLLRPAGHPAMVNTSTLITEQPQSRYGLEALPRELFDNICELLPCSSLLKLRKCSRTFAARIQLNQRFFRSFLLKGLDIPYLWDIDVAECLEADQYTPGNRTTPSVKHHNSDFWDWKSLVRLFLSVDTIVKRGDIEVGSLPGELWNRMRIWKIVVEGTKPKEDNE